MNTINSKHVFTAAFVCGLMLWSVGCQQPGLSKDLNPLSKFIQDDNSNAKPDRMVATWSEAVLHKAGKGTRGFGGRIYFYNRHSTKPQPVEGQFVVYAFEEDNPNVSQDTYTKRFVFPPEQFAKHMSESEIGISYSVWLPWDEVGGEQAEVSLIARFEPLKGGGLVVSDQARQRLPGKRKSPVMVAQEPNEKTSVSMVEQAGYRTSVEVRDIDSQTQPKPRMKAMTIPLPKKFQRPAQGNVPAIPTSNPASVQQGEATRSLPQNHFEPSPVRTSVEYLTPGESVQKSIRQYSFGSTR